MISINKVPKILCSHCFTNFGDHKQKGDHHQNKMSTSKKDNSCCELQSIIYIKIKEPSKASTMNIYCSLFFPFILEEPATRLVAAVAATSMWIDLALTGICIFSFSFLECSVGCISLEIFLDRKLHTNHEKLGLNL